MAHLKRRCLSACQKKGVVVYCILDRAFPRSNLISVLQELFPPQHLFTIDDTVLFHRLIQMSYKLWGLMICLSFILTNLIMRFVKEVQFRDGQ
jgi:hypothetical protein